jgi:hypothetical protein
VRRPLPRALVFAGALVFVVSAIVISSKNHPVVLKKVVEKSDLQNFTKEDSEIKSSPSQQNTPLSQGLFSIEVLPSASLSALAKKAQTKDDSSVPSRNVYRRAIFKPISAQHLRSLSVGSPVTLPLFDGVVAQGHVVLNRAAFAGEPAAISGKIEAPFAGSFAIVEDPVLGLMGFVLPEQGETAYEIESDNGGNSYLDEIPKGDLVCSPYPAHPSFRPAARAAVSSGTRSAGTQAAVPVLRSRVNAKGVLYLDFDGAVVTDPRWASGATINALPSGLSNEKITDIWKVMAEDFRPFDVNVTTVESDYNNGKIGSRMRCIFTPTVDAAPTAGGVAYLGSFKWSGTTPCWAFNGTGSSATSSTAVHYASMTGSHELGHTFNLRHDGDTSKTGSSGIYYAGHGTGVTSWGPIMGAPFTANVIQWSKGEYANANNTEDDVATISGSFFGLGYTVDDYSSSTALAQNIPQLTKGTISAAGVIETSADLDLFRLDCGNGTISVALTGAQPEPNLDAKLSLLNSAGTVVATADPTGTLAASLSSAVSQGIYYLRVAPSSEPNGSTVGYTTYGSIGAYTLSGTFPSNVGYADNFAEASSIPSASSFTLNAISSAATRETSEPAHAGQTAAKSLWWKWTAVGNGRLQVNTKGSGFDTVLAVYSGSSLATLRAFTSNDNAATGVNYSQVDFTTSRGTTYYFAVDGKSGASGAITLTGSGTSLSGPSNDNFTSASAVSGTTWKVSGINFNATRETDEPNHGGTTSGYASVWFQWTPTTSGSYTLTTSGSGFDTLLGVYRGTEINALTLVGANNNSTTGVTWSKVRFTATAGTEYYIAVDGVNRSSGRFSLQLSK